MNPDSPIDPRSALESSLTALLLGELPHEQAAALHQKLAQDAELAKLYERLKQTINLVRETMASPAAQTADQPMPLKLSDERRQKLLQQFKTVAPREFVQPRRHAMPWLVPVGIAAAFVVILGGLFLPALSKSKSRGLSLGSGTWFLSKQAEPAASTPLAAPAPAPANEETHRLFARSMQNEEAKRLLSQAGEAKLGAKPATMLMSANSAIVLPQSSETTVVTPASPVTEGVQAGFAVSATTKGFYDDSSGRAGGVGGGGAFGGFAGSTRGNALVTEGRQAGNVAADSFFSQPEGKDTLASGRPAAVRGRVPAVGEPSSPPVVAGGSIMTWGSQAGRPVETPAPAAVAPPIAANVSAEDSLGKTRTSELAPATVPALTETAPADGAEVGAVQLQALGTDKAAGKPASQVASLGGAVASSHAVAAGGPARKSAGKSDLGVAAVETENLKYQWHNDLGAQSGPANSDAEKVPILGDVPAAGRYFRIMPGAAGGGARAETGSPATLPAPGEQGGVAANYGATHFPLGQQTAQGQNKLGTDLYADQSSAAKASLSRSEDRSSYSGQATAPDGDAVAAGAMRAQVEERVKSVELGLKEELERQTNVGRQESVGYFQLANANPQDVNTALQELFKRKATAREAHYADKVDRIKASPIVLPTPEGETGLALKDSSAVEQKSRQLATAAGTGGRRLDEVQIANSIAGDITDNRRKGSASGEASDRLERRRANEVAKSELDEGKKVSPAAPAPVPQPEVETSANAFSTFSLNVSDVAFKLAGASLEKGVMPEPATVRSEEFINAFDYRDPEPPPGVPVGFAWERAQYPFAQNRDLLRFSIKTAALGRQPGRPLNLVLLLDNSGSMERADRVRIIHEALRVLAGQLQPQDKFSVVTFARTAHLWVDGVPGNQAAQVAEEVSGLTPQGGTNLEDAMNLAYQTALRHYLANGVNRVVLLTDGAANLGNVDPEALKQKVEAHRKQGVALDCFGIGWEGYNDDLLEVLSRNGDGRYAFINTPEEAGDEFAAKLAGALQVAASDVKVQVEFNPDRVTAYRQIGYAKHQLTKEQFRDNTVNAAQIGAAEAGNALYTVEVNPAGTGPLCTVRVRFRIPGTADYREHAWDVPYTGNAVALEQASPAMRLAATASAFSEWLVSSPYAGEVAPDRLLGYLSGVPEVYGADARPKKLEWMIRQAKSLAGK